jgi:3-hydroxyisobutyrate dehydrogenase-like beta-hydroxyacid dehydrogenase
VKAGRGPGRSGNRAGRVGFAGLGRMGLPMARNLLAAGPLTVWNRTPGRTGPLADLGAAVAATPAELGRDCDIVITMLADARAVEQVLTGPAGLLSGVRPGGLIIDMSTIGPAAAVRCGGRAAARGAAFVDAPVSGSVPVAERAALLAMVGGTPGQFDRVRPVLAAMTATQLHLGPCGAGAAMKVALNSMIAATNQAIAEVLLLSGQLGVDPAAAYEVLQLSALASPFVQYKRDAFLAPDSQPPAFAIDLMRKDLLLALDLARDQRIALPAARVHESVLGRASAQGLGQADIALILRALADDPAETDPDEGDTGARAHASN